MGMFHPCYWEQAANISQLKKYRHDQLLEFCKPGTLMQVSHIIANLNSNTSLSKSTTASIHLEHRLKCKTKNKSQIADVGLFLRTNAFVLDYHGFFDNDIYDTILKKNINIMHDLGSVEFLISKYLSVENVTMEINTLQKFCQEKMFCGSNDKKNWTKCDAVFVKKKLSTLQRNTRLNAEIMIQAKFVEFLLLSLEEGKGYPQEARFSANAHGTPLLRPILDCQFGSLRHMIGKVGLKIEESFYKGAVHQITKCSKKKKLAWMAEPCMFLAELSTFADGSIPTPGRTNVFQALVHVFWEVYRIARTKNFQVTELGTDWFSVLDAVLRGITSTQSLEEMKCIHNTYIYKYIYNTGSVDVEVDLHAAVLDLLSKLFETGVFTQQQLQQLTRVLSCIRINLLHDSIPDVEYVEWVEWDLCKRILQQSKGSLEYSKISENIGCPLFPSTNEDMLTYCSSLDTWKSSAAKLNENEMLDGRLTKLHDNIWRLSLIVSGPGDPTSIESPVLDDVLSKMIDCLINLQEIRNSESDHYVNAISEYICSMFKRKPSLVKSLDSKQTEKLLKATALSISRGSLTSYQSMVATSFVTNILRNETDSPSLDRKAVLSVIQLLPDLDDSTEDFNGSQSLQEAIGMYIKSSAEPQSAEPQPAEINQIEVTQEEAKPIDWDSLNPLFAAVPGIMEVIDTKEKCFRSENQNLPSIFRECAQFLQPSDHLSHQQQQIIESEMMSLVLNSFKQHGATVFTKFSDFVDHFETDKLLDDIFSELQCLDDDNNPSDKFAFICRKIESESDTFGAFDKVQVVLTKVIQNNLTQFALLCKFLKYFDNVIASACAMLPLIDQRSRAFSFV
jgi:hypothetical protein